MSRYRYRYRPAARACIMQRRYPHLHLAEKAAATADGSQRPTLCLGCGGFHLIPTTTLIPPTTTTAAGVGARAGGGS